MDSDKDSAFVDSWSTDQSQSSDYAVEQVVNESSVGNSSGDAHQLEVNCETAMNMTDEEEDDEEDDDNMLSTSEEESSENDDEPNDNDDDNDNDENGSSEENEEDMDDDGWESLDEDEDSQGKAEQDIDAGVFSDSSNDFSERCPICLNRFIGQYIGTPNSCDHAFCLECLLEWTKNINTCPVDRQSYKQIFSRCELGGAILDKIAVSCPKRRDQEEEYDADEDVTYCEVCGECDREDRLLLCDHCDHGYHCECLNPPLEHIPIVEWYCPRCISLGNVERNRVDDAQEQSISLRAQRIIARTRASESVRTRIQQRRRVERRSRSQSTVTRRRRKTRKRKRVTRRRKSVKKTKSTGLKRSSTKKSAGKSKRTRRRKVRRRRKTKTRRAVAAARPLVAPTIRKRIADKLGMVKPLPGHLLPQIKKPCLSRSLNSQRFDGGIPTVSLFGSRNDLDVIEEIYENNDSGGVVTINPTAVDHRLSAYNAKMASISSPLRRNVLFPLPLSTIENIDVLGNIMQEQNTLYYRLHEVSIQRNGFLKIDKPTDGLEEKQETGSSKSHNKSNSETSKDNETSNNNILNNNGQSASSNVCSSNIDLFGSDVNENYNRQSDLSVGTNFSSQAKSDQQKTKKKSSNKIFLNSLVELYSDIDDDDDTDNAWGGVKKEAKQNAHNKKDSNENMSAIHNPATKNTTVEKDINKRRISNINNTNCQTDIKSTEKASSELNKCDIESAHTKANNYGNQVKDDQINEKDMQIDDRKEEQLDDEFTDVTPRVNISVLPKIPKIKREKLVEKQDEETVNDSGRSSVLSKIDDGSSDTKWNKLSRFNRDKNISDYKTQSDRSFHGHDNSSRPKSEHFKWSDKNSKDNRNWKDKDEDHFRDRRHGDRQREQDRWERPWRAEQRYEYDNSNFGNNDFRKNYNNRDNRGFRDRKDDYSRGKPGRSPVREYPYDKERNMGGKGNSYDRNRDFTNRNYHKKFTPYEDNYEFRRQSPNRQSRMKSEIFLNKNSENSYSDCINQKERMDNTLHFNDLLKYSPPRDFIPKHKTMPIEWEEKQDKFDEIKARETFWEKEDNERHHSKLCTESQNNDDLKDSQDYLSTSPPSPPENESYDPFDPTESPKHQSNESQMPMPLDIPLPDKEFKPPVSVFSQPFEQPNTNNFPPHSLPNVHVPPPNFIIPTVPRNPFGNVAHQPGMQPFNWATPPPPTILMPPLVRGNFLPPPMPPRMMGPPGSQPQMGLLPPPLPGPVPVMGARGPTNSGPLIPNLPPPPCPPPMPNINIPHQISLTNIAHPPPPPPLPLIGNAIQTSIPNAVAIQASIPSTVVSHPIINRNQIFTPITVTHQSHEPALPVSSSQIPVSMNSSHQSTAVAPVQVAVIASMTSTVSSTPVDKTVIPQSKPVSKKNIGNVPAVRTAYSTTESPAKNVNVDATKQSLPRDVTEVVDMDVDSPFSPTNSPLDFDDMSLASSIEKSTPSPSLKDNILLSPRPKTIHSKFENLKSSPKLKPRNNKSNTKVKPKPMVSCGQSLLEEVWAKHILSEFDEESKNKDSKDKKKSSEKVRVIRDFSVKKDSFSEGPFRMEEDQLKILDEIPSSAVEMQVKEKYLKKLNRQERVVEEVKLALKPYYNKRDIDKEEYKEILRKCVPKICHNRSGAIIPKKIKCLVEAYVEKLSYHRKKPKSSLFSNT